MSFSPGGLAPLGPQTAEMSLWKINQLLFDRSVGPTPPVYPPVNTQLPQIAAQSGFPAVIVGGVINLTQPGIWTNSPVLTYQWLKNGVAIVGQTNPDEYTAQAGDVGSTISLLEIPNSQMEDGVESSGSLVLLDVPVNVTPPVISADGGTVGATLTDEEDDTWNPAPDSRVRQWVKDGSGLDASALTYLTDSAGEYTLRVTTSNAGGVSETAISNAIVISE